MGLPVLIKVRHSLNAYASFISIDLVESLGLISQAIILPQDLAQSDETPPIHLEDSAYHIIGGLELTVSSWLSNEWGPRWVKHDFYVVEPAHQASSSETAPTSTSSSKADFVLGVELLRQIGAL
jgi:hypothetical protein